MIEKVSATKQIDRDYDAIVIGSGISGGWAAKELTELGLKTLVLERGRHVVHGQDYITEHKPAWDMEFKGLGDRRGWREEKFNQTQSRVVNEGNAHFFVNDRENPYSCYDDTKYLWIRGYHTGGRSLMWGRQTYRLSDLDFEANLREGIGVDWPIRYSDVSAWYDYVERFAGITGSTEGIPWLPDGVFLPPMEMTCVEQHAKGKIEAAFPGRHVIMGRAAVLTRPHLGRGACHYCGPCDRGCSVGAYFSSLSSTLPAAAATGNLTLRPDSIVHSLVYDPSDERVTGVRLIDRVDKTEHEIGAKVVFLCASTMGSTQVLLNSVSETFPNGLGNSSGVLGHYVMDHHFRVGATATFQGFEDKYYFGNRPNGIYIPRFRNIGDDVSRTDFYRGYGFEGEGYRASWMRGATEKGFGRALKERLRDPGPWAIRLNGFGETLPDFSNYVELDHSVTDEWGLPTLKFHCSLGENELKMREDMAATAAEMLEAAGGENVSPYFDQYFPGEGIHEMGTARMGRDPSTSVLNAHNQVHGVPNVFVTDGACMTSSACQNPSLTYMALTARAAHFAVEEMKARRI